MNTLTLQDVADLAKVRRPVVSMWRKRPMVRGVSMPFPEPVSSSGGVARFDRDEIVDWLTRTGRGNNAEQTYDAPALAVPDDAALEDVVTLLCWHALTGQDLADTSAARRVQLADEFDPDDELLVDEIRQLTVTDAVLDYVDDLISATRGAADALTYLESGRLKRQLGMRDLSAAGIDLTRAIIEAVAVFLEQDDVLLDVDSVVALDVAESCGVGIATADRALRRRAVIRDIQRQERGVQTRVSTVSLIGLGLAESLERVDQVVLGLGAGDVAVLVGSAAALADQLSGPLQSRRAQTLRVKNLVAALRLPRGLWREAHRQSLAVWVCVGNAGVEQPCVADLAAVDQIELTDLAADVAGALAQSARRAFLYMRRIGLSAVLASGPVVPQGVRAVRLGGIDAATHMDNVHRSTLVTTAALSPLDVLVAPSPGNIRLQRRSLGELHSHGHLEIKRGRRINPADASIEGTVRVLPTEIAGPIALDPFDAEQKYQRAVRTEPGDVIFVEKPHPRAWVDAVGGAMVASPARVIRLRESAEVGPMVLATSIIETATAGTEWPTWSVPVLSRDETERLEAALIQVDDYEREARRRVDAARELKTALIDGVAAGALTLDAQPTTPGVAGARR
ncbi:hypothetical protein [Mycobacterium sp. HM-7]